MDQPYITRLDAALSFTTTPTDQLRFLCAGDADRPDIGYEQLAPGDGPPLHRHPWATWSIVVDGTILMRIADADHQLGPGDLAYTPPDVVHSFLCIGTENARMIHIDWPGGFHRLYAELAAAFNTGGPPDFPAMVAAAARHHAEIVGPPLSLTPPTV